MASVSMNVPTSRGISGVVQVSQNWGDIRCNNNNNNNEVFMKVHPMYYSTTPSDTLPHLVNQQWHSHQLSSEPPTLNGLPSCNSSGSNCADASNNLLKIITPNANAFQDDYLLSDLCSSLAPASCTGGLCMGELVSGGSHSGTCSSVLTPLTPSTGPSSVDTNSLASDRLYSTPERATNTQGPVRFSSSSFSSHYQSSHPNLPSSPGRAFKWQMQLNFLSVHKLSTTSFVASPTQPESGCQMPGSTNMALTTMHPAAWLLVDPDKLCGDGGLAVDKLFIEKNRCCELFIHLQQQATSSSVLGPVVDLQKEDLCLLLEPFSMTQDDHRTKFPLRGCHKQTSMLTCNSNVAMESVCFVNCRGSPCEYQELSSGSLVCVVPLRHTQETVSVTFPHLNSKCESAWKKNVFLECALLCRSSMEVVAPPVRFQIYCCSSPARDANRMFAKLCKKRDVPPPNALPMGTFTPPSRKRSDLDGIQLASSDASPSKMQKLKQPLNSGNSAALLGSLLALQNVTAATSTLSSPTRVAPPAASTQDGPQYAVLTTNLTVWKILNNLKVQLEQLVSGESSSDTMPSI